MQSLNANTLRFNQIGVTMENFPHNLVTLFDQLGLASDDASIHSFIAGHRLNHNVRLFDAPFWSSAQSSFLRESLHQDADWAEAIDELDARLRGIL